ncbi:M48 family metalloprotease [Thiocystis violascens]|uniref:Zn-dependent protease with chaperone function n=1 Tax=Thiocystis violascens (strain ATCC 17096 / DSM 198 / 6111) TaxID=765911 RepID=I3YH76_THIV6|nr:M48 family metalloprotease [Thiocystis violascens]AFL76344.1 Zn-dependent protease with chaperone function [Thiocystis violascens DSM 198]
MDTFIYPREITLSRITLVLGLLAWAIIVVGTIGIALIYVLLLFIGYLFAQSAFISWIKGNGVRLSAEQLPDLYASYETCCTRLDMKERPEAYLLQGEGMLNAFATRFLGRDFVVLLSSTVDAMAQHPDGVNFYIGHELGHIRRKHLTGWKWRAPVLWLPLLGAAYSRAREYTCDRHGAACCGSPEQAARALGALAAGSERWRDLHLAGFSAQTARTREFWMSFHELINGYPWLCKRAQAILQPETAMPSRHPLAWPLALLVPNTGAGASGLLIMVAMIGILAAIAIPAYQDYLTRVQTSAAWQDSSPIRDALASHYEQQRSVPDSLESVGLATTLPNGSDLSLNGENMVLSIALPVGEMLLVPSDNEGAIIWECQAGAGLKPNALPSSCRQP